MKWNTKNILRIVAYIVSVIVIVQLNVYFEQSQKESLSERYMIEELNSDVFLRLDRDFGILTDSRTKIDYEGGQVAHVNEYRYWLDYAIDYDDSITDDVNVRQLRNYVEYREEFDSLNEWVEIMLDISLFVMFILFILLLFNYERIEDSESVIL